MRLQNMVVAIALMLALTTSSAMTLDRNALLSNLPDLSGVIYQVGDDFIVLVDQKVFLSETTKILNSLGIPVSFNTLKKGATVKVYLYKSLVGRRYVKKIIVNN